MKVREAIALIESGGWYIEFEGMKDLEVDRALLAHVRIDTGRFAAAMSPA